MLLTGADIVVECLKEQKVDTVFGYPGGNVIHIYDSLYKNKKYIKHILTAHEQGASHAADGYARSTGKVGVCIATSGPGATNLVTGIATAYMDSVPMVIITGNVPLSLLGKDSFQEVDIAGVTAPITKHNYIVKDINKLADTIRDAFYIASEGRQGPVLIDIPKDIAMTTTDYEFVEPKLLERCTKNITKEAIDNALKLINKSKQPFIYIGGGVVRSEASKELLEFAEKIDAPVTSSLMGLGGFPSSHELFTGMIGMHGTKASNKGINKSDLIIAIGARFSDRVVSKVEKFAPNAKILHIDIDPAEINKNVVSYHYIVGDIREVLKQLNNNITKQDRKQWVNKIKGYKDKYPLSYPDNGLKAQYIIEKLNDITDENTIVATEVGQHQMWTAQYYNFNSPKEFLTSGGLGTMGFGLGAAIGAQVGNPTKTVINIAGDGCFKMNLIELATAVNYNLPIIIILINNNSLGMVRQWQSLFFDGRYSETTLNHATNFVGLAENFGMRGLEISRKEQVEDVLQEAINCKRPVLVHCRIHEDDKVFPMVAPGEAIDSLIMEG
ncbi:biosynthetic-type acetolactate synthase large subunit [Vallitalea sp.]|jgi:acetolactate synthase-1/2/3 large subunit|uniref:biosynthetic-type acetolactate synthase large subunit n=1 Tax=Vallitalea sp. TaxID=1882829 RepID=UPI0025D1D353|nr:biosynthetic-type acetolactate synthase large subunit [Vallitalea sp.]MCT4685981.1 biosynthetic-type acetolactate synthase large subunit [Vallitalea sp.]